MRWNAKRPLSVCVTIRRLVKKLCIFIRKELCKWVSEEGVWNFENVIENRDHKRVIVSDCQTDENCFWSPQGIGGLKWIQLSSTTNQWRRSRSSKKKITGWRKEPHRGSLWREWSVSYELTVSVMSNKLLFHKGKTICSEMDSENIKKWVLHSTSS